MLGWERWYLYIIFMCQSMIHRFGRWRVSFAFAHETDTSPAAGKLGDFKIKNVKQDAFAK